MRIALKSLFQVHSYQGHFFYSEGLTNKSANDNIEGLDFRDLTEDDFVKSAIFKEKDRCKRYRLHLLAGYKCMGFVTEEDEVVFYLWYTTDGVVQWFKGLRIRLTQSQTYIWDCRTQTAWQKRGLYKLALQKMVFSLTKAGTKTILIDCACSNKASEKGILNAGFKPYKKFRVLKIRSLFLIHFARKLLMGFSPKDISLS